MTCALWRMPAMQGDTTFCCFPTEHELWQMSLTRDLRVWMGFILRLLHGEHAFQCIQTTFWYLPWGFVLCISAIGQDKSGTKFDSLFTLSNYQGAVFNKLSCLVRDISCLRKHEFNWDFSQSRMLFARFWVSSIACRYCKSCKDLIWSILIHLQTKC